MSSSIAALAASPPTQLSVYRGTAGIVVAFGLLAGGVGPVAAQTSIERASATEPVTVETQHRWEFLVASGTLMPTGSQREVVKRADMTVAQLTYVIRPELAVTTSLGWARSRDIATAGSPKLDVITSDLGAEYRPAQWLAGRTVTVTPFAGVGAGARSYRHHSPGIDTTSDVAAYLSAGGEIGIRRIHLRLELRDYLTGFRAFSGDGSSGSRNDVVAMLGLRLSK